MDKFYLLLFFLVRYYFGPLFQLQINNNNFWIIINSFVCLLVIKQILKYYFINSNNTKSPYLVNNINNKNKNKNKANKYKFDLTNMLYNLILLPLVIANQNNLWIIFADLYKNHRKERIQEYLNKNEFVSNRRAFSFVYQNVIYNQSQRKKEKKRKENEKNFLISSFASNCHKQMLINLAKLIEYV